MNLVKFESIHVRYKEMQCFTSFGTPDNGPMGLFVQYNGGTIDLQPNNASTTNLRNPTMRQRVTLGPAKVLFILVPAVCKAIFQRPTLPDTNNKITNLNLQSNMIRAAGVRLLSKALEVRFMGCVMRWIVMNG